MTLIVASGEDRDVLMRWSDAALAGGHHFLVKPPRSVLTAAAWPADICLYDLGAQRDADTTALLKAVAKRPNTKFIAMTAVPNAGEGLRVLKGGVRGYCNRLASPAIFNALISAVASGEVWAGKQVTDFLLEQAIAGAVERPDTSDVLKDLTRREAEIALQVADGMSNKVIAAENGISERTVKAHLNSIFRKTGLSNRVQLALAISQTQETPRELSNG